MFRATVIVDDNKESIIFLQLPGYLKTERCRRTLMPADKLLIEEDIGSISGTIESEEDPLRTSAITVSKVADVYR